MKKPAAIALAICLFGPLGAVAQTPANVPTPTAAPAGAPSAPATSVAVPGGTSVSVNVREPISSSTATVGETVPIIVTKEVDLSGWVIIPKGANGQATITAAEHAAGNGHGGKLGMSVDWVFSSDGGKIQLSQVNHSAENGDQKGASSTATIATYLLLGPLGLFAHNWVHGKDVTIEADHVFTVFVDHDIHVQATQKANAAAGFDG
ncbi:MAG: hypothetical protein GIW97_01595 [Candidatus Eremiobacteraeota bacterium]|nr:hypothetical protein [Candidatus Eremiobacteraeota bacterium]